MSNGNVTVSEIARASRVSVPAVYQALNQGGRLSTTTRTRILDVAHRLGYRPNAAAQAISTGRFNCVSLLLSSNDRRSNLPDRMLSGISEALSARDQHLTITLLPDEQLTSEGVIPKILRQWLADGLIINYTDHIPDRMVTLINENTIPSVWMNSKRSADAVYPDDLDAGRRATEALLKLGHRAIAYVDFSYGLVDNEPIHYSSIDRQAGYELAMASAGLKTDIVRPPTPRAKQRVRVKLAEELLNRKDRPTAVVTYSGSTAVPLVFAATKKNLDVPRDLSIITFDTEALALTGVTFTTMVVPNFELGRCAVDMLLSRIDVPGVPINSRVLPFTFDEGESIGPPATRK